MSLTTFTVWTCCYVVAQTFPMLNDSPSVGPARTFAAYSMVSLLAFVFVGLYVPETKGRTLEEIERIWA
jgi:MFS transporter, SP family, arabinose:H+ symporter